MPQARRAPSSAAFVAVAYAAFGLSWIFLSDRLLYAVAPDSLVLSTLGTWKGVAFVVASSALLYFVGRRHAAAAAGGSDRPAARLPARTWGFALAAAVILLMGLLGVAHTAREVRSETLAKLRAVAELKAGLAAEWLQRQRSAAPDDARERGHVQRLLQRVHAAPRSEDVRVLLFRRAGAQLVFLGPDGREHAVAGQRLPHLGVPADPAGQAQEGPDERGEPALAYVLPLEGSPWALAVQMPRDRLRAHVWSHAAWIVLVDGLAILLAAVLAYVAWQRRELETAERHAAEQHDKLRAWRLLDAIANGTTDAIYALDTRGRLLFVNRQVCRLTGRSAEALIGCPAAALLPRAEARRVAGSLLQVLREDRVAHRESALTTPDGTRTYLHTLGPLRDHEGRVVGAFGISRDITERKREEDQRRQWAAAFESTRDGVLITDAQGRIEAVNRAFTEITGYSGEDALGATPRLLQSGRHGPQFYRALWTALREQGSWQGEIWNRRKNGSVYPEWLSINPVRDAAGALANYVGVFTDITHLKNTEARLERLAHYDPLTDLPNRRLLQTRLEQALAHARRHATSVAVLFIDLDGFKTVNDSLGHPVGDQLLVCVAERLRARLRQDDTLGRVGGDEFVVVLESIRQPNDVAVLAQALLSAVAEPVQLAGGQEAYVTASIGISIFPEDGSSSAVEMLRDADAAMYRAKDEGRNRFSFYTRDLNAGAVARLEIEAALSRAAARGELLLHYQPKVVGRGGRIAGVEALLRWRRNGGALVPPAQFIPIAERSSLILDIGAWVIDSACRQIRQWIDAGLPAPCVAVNVAARQFAAGNLDSVIAEALQRHGVPAACLEVELTESMLVDHPDAAAKMLRKLKALGLKLSLDDFGTGYSSLAYLQRFAIDALKIDASFVQSIGGATGDTLVDAIIGLAHRLQLRVVAEGVETEAQRDYLVRQGCDELQGYLFSMPVSAQEMQTLLRAQALVAA
ncbi:MAG: EAL domain-containing protein [Pseudomonadota bacterium]